MNTILLLHLNLILRFKSKFVISFLHFNKESLILKIQAREIQLMIAHLEESTIFQSKTHRY